MNDPVGDALIRVKNGYLAGKMEVSMPFSKLISNLCNLLVKEGYVESVKQEENALKVTLKYEGRNPALSDVKRISKPGLRVYKGVKAIPSVLNGMGIVIVSTPKGLLTDKQARKEGVGGEIMAFVW